MFVRNLPVARDSRLMVSDEEETIARPQDVH